MWPRMCSMLTWTKRECCLVFVAISLDQSPFVSDLDIVQEPLWRPHHILSITPFRGNKYVQSCILERLLICQISCCQCIWLLKQGLVQPHIANLERKKHSFSQNNPVTARETQRIFSSAWKEKNMFFPMLPINNVCESTGLNKRV